MRLRHEGLSLGLAAALLAGASPASAAVTADEALARALAHVRGNAATLGVTTDDVADLSVNSNYPSAHNGVTHVNLNQRYQGLEVFGGTVSVAVKSDGGILHAAGSLVKGLSNVSGAAALDAPAAVESAAAALGLAPPVGLQVLSDEGGPARRTTCSSAGVSREPIPARLGWQPTATGLRKAWQLVIDDSSAAHVWNATVDAETGALLEVQDLTTHDPIAELEATLGQAILASTVAVAPPNPVIDGSSYRVLAVPTESPNDRARELIDNPADGDASPWGWHDTNGAVGPEFTTTRGNNAHAYLDQDANNQPDFAQDVDGGAGLDFDFAADLAEHAQSYRPAVTTNLFYGCNVIHDITWRYGFDEASGNFQANNYGRGGVGGDYARCEAADGNGTNNANFNTPVNDGGTPRMQMFLWPGNQFGAQNEVVVDGLGSFGSSWARFSPPPTVAGTAGRIINAGNGCVAADYAGAPSGDWMAIVTGSNAGCQNIQKARVAGTAGAKALIVAVNNTGDAPVLTGTISATSPAPVIPVASITQADGDAIRAAIAAGDTSGTVRKHPAHPGIRDGDFENGIIFHEYGHGISSRLTGGVGNSCLGGNEQAGEGWSDYIALTLLLDPNLDAPEGPRGMGPYALFQPNRQGNGIRPRPYSRNMTIQPFTYDSIKSGAWLGGISLSTPHGIGHGWASILWDMNWDLIEKHGFNPDIYADWDTGGNNRAFQYMMDGLKLQGCQPGFVAARNGILAGTAALGGADTCTVWATFARRGVGFSAIQGTTNRDDNTEAFDTNPSCRQGFRSPVLPTYGTLNPVVAGDTVPLKFTVAGATGLDILASNSPFSRKVDCATLRVPSSGEFITPRELPIATNTPGNSGLTRNANGVYHYNWKTELDWGGTCREVVVTRKDGVQHRAFFQFTAGI